MALLGVLPCFLKANGPNVHPNAPGLLYTPPLDKHREKGEACPWPTDTQDLQDVVGLRVTLETVQHGGVEGTLPHYLTRFPSTSREAFK